MSEYFQAWYEANKARVRENQRRRRNSLTTPQRLVEEARIRAKRKGLPFDLTHEDVQDTALCPILGIRLQRGTGTLCDASPTLDRINPDLGYVKGNVAIISHRANTIKNNGTAEEHERIAAWIRNQANGVAS